MDHNLEESLKLGVGFEHSVVLSEETDICLDDSNVGKTMEFETIEEQQILMDTEVIHNVGETYSLQMSGNDMPMLGGEEEVFSQESIDTIIDNSISQELDTVSQNHSLETMEANTVKTDDVLISHVSIKPVPSEPTQVTSVQVNIAPPSSANNPAISSETIKPTLANIKIVSRSKEYLPIAPKPWTTNRPQTVTVTTASKPKQIIIPSNSTQQKIKIVSSGLQYIQDDKGHLYTAKRVGNKQILTKVASHPTKDTNTSEATSVNKPRIVSSGLPKLVMAKVLTPNGDMMTRYIPVEAAQQMGIVQRRQTITNAGNKVFMPSLRHQSLITTPTKQVVTIKQPTVQPKLAPISTQGVPQKKVLITPVSSVQNVVLRSAPPKSIQMSSKESKLAGGAVLTNIAPAPQKQQKVQQSITVPGKGVQYIRLVQPSIKGQQSVLNVANKAVLVTDAQGNLLQMSTEEPIEPQLLVAAANKIHQQQQVKVNKTPNQKLVVLSPASQQNANFPQIVRVSGQSILKAKQKQTIQIVKAEEKAIKEIDEKIPAAGAISIIQDKETVMNETLDQISSNQKEKEKSLTTTRDEVQVTEKENSCGVINDETVDTPIGVVDDSNSSQLEKPSQDTSNEQEELEEEDDDGEEIEPKWKKMRQNSNIDYSRHDESKNDEKIQDYNIEIEPALLEEFKSKYEKGDSIKDLVMRSRKACNCTKSQCLKLYCDCFANGEFCNGCNCFSCHNNLEHEELRQVAIRGCLERNPRAFRPKIGKAKEEPTRRHFKGCNCKRSGCLKNYCECFEAKIACSGKCKCVGCRNVDEMLHRVNYDNVKTISTLMPPMLREPCSLVTSEVVEAVCQCLMAAASESEATRTNTKKEAATIAVLFEFSRCLRDVISASARAQATT